MRYRWQQMIAGVIAMVVLAVIVGGFGVGLPAEALSAASAIVMEVETGQVLFERDAHTPRAMASTTKIMTALIALESMADDIEITISAEAVRVEGSALGLRGGDKISAGDLVTGMMLASGNDAAGAVAYAVAGGLPEFAVLMNRRAAELGMNDTLFVTPSGLDAEGHASTAYDMALLAAAAMGNPRFAKICAMESAVVQFGNPMRGVTVNNHNKLLRLYEPAVGIKTGFTKKAGRCLVSAAERDGISLVAVTLNAPDDWDDHEELFEQGFPMVEPVQFALPELAPLKVCGGDAGEVGLSIPHPPERVMLKSDTAKVRIVTELPRFVFAPVAPGDVVGRVSYELDGQVLFAGDVTAVGGVTERPVAGYWSRVADGIGRLFIILCE